MFFLNKKLCHHSNENEFDDINLNFKSRNQTNISEKSEERRGKKDLNTKCES
jgi:hypothetical protein